MAFGGSGTGIKNASDVFFSNLSDEEILRFNATTQKWNNATLAFSATDLADASITEPKLAVSNNPATNQMLGWDGTSMTWMTPSSGTDDGTRLLDTFAGATDDDKLTAAIAWQKATSGMPAIRLGSRVHNFNQTRTLYTGLKLIGTPAGPRNIELNGANYVPTRIRLGSAITNGPNSWWVGGTSGSNDYYDIYMADFGVDGKSSAGAANEQQFLDCYYDGATVLNNMYACQFEALSFNFMYGVFGNVNRKCAVTQVVFSGHWTANNLRNTQFNLGGSDNNLWMEGYINIGPPGTAYTGAGYNSFQMIFDSLTKTNIGFMFVTALNGWRGIVVRGNNSHGLRFFGGAYEGMNSSKPAPGTVIRLEGGAGSFFNPSVGQGMASPDTTNEKGLIHMSGGEWSFFSPSFYKNGMPESTPFIYHSAGRLMIIGATKHRAESWTTRPRYQTSFTTGSGDNSFYCPDMSMDSV